MTCQSCPQKPVLLAMELRIWFTPLKQVICSMGSLMPTMTPLVSAASVSTEGALEATSNGEWSYTPEKDFNGNVEFNYLVDDGNGGQVATRKVLIIDAVNDAPELTGTATTLPGGAEDTAYTITKAQLLAGFSDVDRDAEGNPQTLDITDLTAKTKLARSLELLS